MAKKEPIQLDPEIALAFDKIDTKGCRDKMQPGEYAGRCTVELDYNYKIGKDTDAAASSSVPWKRLFAAAMQKLNAATQAALIQDVLDAVDGEALDTFAKQAEATMTPRLEAIAAKLPRIPRKGAVTGTCSVRVLSEVPAGHEMQTTVRKTAEAVEFSREE